jgi:hypothetical protein
MFMQDSERFARGEKITFQGCGDERREKVFTDV